MPKNDLSRSYPIHAEKEGSIESQIFRLTNRVVRLTQHSQIHRKDYSSQRGLWKILGRRKRLLIYLLQTDVIGYRDLISRLEIRKLKKK
jgi:ribosomal protein S15